MRRESKRPGLQRQDENLMGAHEHEQKGKGRKRDRSSYLSRDTHSVGFSGIAATAAALDTHRGSPVVPVVVRQGTGGRQHVEPVGSRLSGEHGGTGTTRDRSAESVPQPDHLHHQRDAAGYRAKRKSGGLTVAAGQLVKVSQEKEEGRVEFLEYCLASAEESRARRAQQQGAFFAERKAWLDATAKAVRPAIAKFFAYVLFKLRDGLHDGRLVRRATREELAEQMRMHKNTVHKATKILTAAGKLHVVYHYNPETRQRDANEYHACGYVQPPRKPRKEKVPF